METKQYTSYIITEASVENQEILIAELSDFGFDGFEQTEISISANGLSNNINIAEVKSFLNHRGIPFTIQSIEEQNWNAQWEQSFDPIIIEKFCAVRASFHLPVKNVEHEIVITPKMSFGTGHHATTYMMLQAMQRINFSDKSVIDFGTGTGILAILAEKLGAENIDAVDYDDWCIENGKENIVANHCAHINLIKASNLEGILPADVILANINKHVILSSLPELKSKLNVNGTLLISGILEADEEEVTNVAQQYGFYKSEKQEKKGWICVCFGLS